jgi:hypothetical protein
MIDAQWIKENTCRTCGMVITNRWESHRIYKECEKELAKKGLPMVVNDLSELGYATLNYKKGAN